MIDRESPLEAGQKFRVTNIEGQVVPKEIYGKILKVDDPGHVILRSSQEDPNVYVVQLLEHVDDELATKNDDKVVRRFDVGRKFFNALEDSGDITYYTDDELESLYFKPIVSASRLDMVDD